jgi:16S rRNA (guanine1516-N2)-methyltransferase
MFDVFLLHPKCVVYLCLRCINTPMPERFEDLELKMTPDGLTLAGVRVDFDELHSKFKMQPLSQQQLLKALGSVQDFPRVLDLTAGFGRDAFLMAMKGHHVTCLERNKEVFELVQDALKRARFSGKISFLDRIDHKFMDAFDELKNLTGEYDALYLDPMYPQRETSALPKKEIQVLREWLGINDKTMEEIDQETKELLVLALQKTKRKVILKRPLWAEPLMKPRHSFEGKLSRFDTYIIRD